MGAILKMDIEERVWGMNWFDLAFVNTGTSLRVPYNAFL
jgi:hypothetical protein